MDNNKYYFKMPRRLFETKWWQDKNKLTEIEAFAYLCYYANDNCILEVSMRMLAREWNWSITKVCRFLKALEDDGYIITGSTQYFTVVKLVDYDNG